MIGDGKTRYNRASSFPRYETKTADHYTKSMENPSYPFKDQCADSLRQMYATTDPIALGRHEQAVGCILSALHFSRRHN